jgi:toxin HigB-1
MYRYNIHPKGDLNVIVANSLTEGWLRIRFRSKKLTALYEHETGSEKFPAEVVDAFFHLMTVIRAAWDERDFRVMKSLHFENLKADRKGQQSFRLNKQWRLIVSLQKDDTGKYLSIIEIENHYKK